MIGDDEKAICRKVASTFCLAASQNYNPLSFTRAWFQSRAARLLYQLDFNEIAQGRHYQLNSLLMEFPLEPESEKQHEDIEDIMYWVGYIVTYFSFWKEITPREVFEFWDVKKIIATYPALHCMSPKRACEEIYLEMSLYADRLVRQARREIDQTGRITVVCPRCGKSPEMTTTPRGERTIIQCPCRYIVDVEINL